MNYPGFRQMNHEKYWYRYQVGTVPSEETDFRKMDIKNITTRTVI
jgi:hypothetical protein